MNSSEIKFAVIIIIVTVVFLAVMAMLYIRTIKKINSYTYKGEEKSEEKEKSDD